MYNVENASEINEWLAICAPLTFKTLDELMKSCDFEYLTTYENLVDIITSSEFDYCFIDKETKEEHHLFLNWRLADTCKYSKYEIMQAVYKYQDAINYALKNHKSTKNLKEFDKIYDIWKNAKIDVWYDHEEHV